MNPKMKTQLNKPKNSESTDSEFFIIEALAGLARGRARLKTTRYAGGVKLVIRKTLLVD